MTFKNTISKDSSLSDSIFALSSRVRFVKQNLMSSEFLLRIVVNKSHYPKFLVNYPFVPLTVFLDLSESVVWNESGTNRETRTNHKRIRYDRTNQERIMNRERIRNTGTNQEHPLQWKMTPLQWKMTVTPPVEIKTPPVEMRNASRKLVVDPTSGNM
jgi:hypothetical protein